MVNWPPNNLLAEFSPTRQLLHWRRHHCEINYSEVRAVLTIVKYLTSFNPLVLWSRAWFQCGPPLSWSQQNSYPSYPMHVVIQIFLKHLFTHLPSAKVLILLQISAYLCFYSKGFCTRWLCNYLLVSKLCFAVAFADSPSSKNELTQSRRFLLSLYN